VRDKSTSQSYYLDLSWLLMLETDGTESRSDMNWIFAKLKKYSNEHGFKMIVPMHSLGETVNKILTDHKSESEKLIKDMIKNLENIGADYPPARFEDMALAIELSGIEGKLRPTDALILAQAINDEDAVCLVTADGILVGSNILQQAVIEKRKDGRNLRITDTDI